MSDNGEWLEITLVNKSIFSLQDIENALLSSGALSITLTNKNSDNILIESSPGDMPIWESEIMITGLFNKKNDIKEVLSKLKSFLNTSNLPLLSSNKLENKVWELEWAKYFKPIQFNNNLWICTSKNSVPKNKINKNTQIITLDPGLAFGTGTHPTTAMAIKYIANNNVGIDIVDYGCGSGILGITSIKMGAKKAYMIDIDEQALITTKKNAKINLVSKNITCYLAGNIPDIKADFLIANILLEPLLQLKNTFIGLCKKNSKILLTGLLEKQVNQIIEKYKDSFYNFNIVKKDGWSMVIAKRK